MFNSKFPIKNSDIAYPDGFVGIFGERSAESWQTDISMNFVYGLPCDKHYDLSTGGNVTTSSNLLHVDNIGGIGRFQTKDRVRYRNGHSISSRFTTVLSVQPISARVIVINNSNIINSKALDISNIDFTKGQIYQISYGYLGYAPVKVDILKGNNFLTVANILFHNLSENTHISNPYSAFTCKVEDEKITVGLFEDDSGVAIEFVMPSGNQYCRMGSIFAGVMTENLSPSNIYGHHRFRKEAITSVTHAGTTWRNIATYKSIETFKGVPNKIIAALGTLNYLLFGLASSETDYVVCLAKNAIPTTPFSFSEIRPCSTVHVDTSNTDLTIVETDIIWSNMGYAVSGQGSRPGSFSSQTENSVRDGLTLDPGNGSISIAVKCPINFSFSHSLLWRELF